MLSFSDKIALYANRRQAVVFLTGFSSGIPLLLTASTLVARLKDSGMDYSTMGLFSLVGLPYTLKFLWAPFVERLKVPILHRMGMRRSQIVLMQILLMSSIGGMAAVEPRTQLYWLAILAVLTAFLSSIQDIFVDAFRVELLSDESQAAGSATSVFGYRLAMLVTGAGALALSDFFPWSTVYLASMMTLSVGMAGVLLAEEPEHPVEDVALRWFEKIKRRVVSPLKEFGTRRMWVPILLFVMMFKLGDAVAGAMLMPFYMDCGFEKVEIAAITKVFGFIATIAGTFLGGFLVKSQGMFKSLMFCGILQLLTNFVFILLLHHPQNSMLTLAIGLENIASGMGTAAFVGYISVLCNREFTATQYALLSASASVGRSVLSSYSGYMVEAWGWAIFFCATAALAVPGLLFLSFLSREKRVGDVG